MSRIAPRRRSPPTAFQTHALAYARVSTEEQVLEGVSLEAQVASLHAYLALRGLVLHPLGILLERGVSGGIPLEKRPEGQRLVEAVRRGEVAHVVTVKLDRLFRSAENCLAQLGQWEASGVALHLVDMGGQSIDTRSTLGRFMITVLAGVAEMERGLIKDRTRTALAHKRQQGEKLGGDVPYGYRAQTGPGGAPVRLEAHPEEQRVLQRARHWKAAGHSLRAIGRLLTQEGLYPRTGQQWHPEQIRRVVESSEENRWRNRPEKTEAPWCASPRNSPMP